MVNIAKQNQYVEFAEKDSKGRNIAEKIDELDSKPAGTKLYKHSLSFRGVISPDTSSRLCNIVIISASATPITLYNDYGNMGIVPVNYVGERCAGSGSYDIVTMSAYPNGPGYNEYRRFYQMLNVTVVTVESRSAETKEYRVINNIDGSTFTDIVTPL